MKKWKIYSALFLIVAAVIAKFVLYDYVVDDGKWNGSISEFSQKGFILNDWHGKIKQSDTGEIQEFIVTDKAMAEQMAQFKDEELILYYREYLYPFPRQGSLQVIAWERIIEDEPLPTTEEVVAIEPEKNNIIDEESDQLPVASEEAISTAILDVFGRTLFCSLLGTLYQDQELYQKVKGHVKEKNLYLFKQISKCND